MQQQPGNAAVQGFKPKHPIIIVPGFVTSGLELWVGKKCAAKYFRCPHACHKFWPEACSLLQ